MKNGAQGSEIANAELYPHLFRAGPPVLLLVVAVRQLGILVWESSISPSSSTFSDGALEKMGGGLGDTP